MQAALNTLLVGEKSSDLAGREKLCQQTEPLSGELAAHQVDARDIRAGLVETRDNSLGHGIAGHKSNGDGCRDSLRGPRGRCAAGGGNHGRLQRSQFASQFPQLIVLAVGPAIFDLRRLAIDVSKSSEPPEKALKMWLRIFQRPAAEKANGRHGLLLGARDRGPRYAASDKPEKFPPSHALPSPLRAYR